MKNNHTFSIRAKLIFIMLFVIISIFFVYIVTNKLFLEDYYMEKKEKMILETYDEVSMVLDGKDLSDTNVQNKLAKLCESYMITIFVADSLENTKYYYGNGRSLERRLDEILFLEDSNVRVIKKTDKYVLQFLNGDADNHSYYEMWGHLDGSRFFLIRMTVENIQESAEISRHFFLYVGVIISVISGLAIFVISGKLVKPIYELSLLSRKMADMDFEAKFENSGTTEIDVLGNSMNELSGKLKNNILELKRANSELRKDIKEKDQIDEMRREFISNVSHELKTPIALILGYSEGLEECINDDAESREFYCDVIKDEAGKMNKMVKSLLELNQLEFGNSKLQIEHFDINQVVRGVVSSLDLMIKQSDISISVDITEESVFVYADEFQIEGVLTNYITNAIHYALYEKKIRIFLEKKEKCVRVNVYNSGDNIPEDELEKIWIKFYKIDKARTREYGGSGIGLSIVKAIIKSLGQECGVTNVQDGVVFWFELEC